MKGNHPRRALVSLLFVALAAAGLAQSQMRGDSFAPVIDSEAYLLQGLRLAAGDDIVEGVYFQAPLYPILLGTALRLAGVPGTLVAERIEDLSTDVLSSALWVGRTLNVLCGLVLVILVWRIGCRLFSPGTGLAAGLLAAFYGPFLFYQGHLLKVSLSLLFLPWAVLAVARAFESGRDRALVWAGLALGLGGLVRGNMHLLAGLAVLALLLHGASKLEWRRGLIRAAWLVGGVALAVAPVVLRNSLVAGRPVLGTAAGGTAFYLCNHAGNSTGLVQHTVANRQIPRHELGDWRQGAEAAMGRSLSPAEISSYWSGRALDDIVADPARWSLLELRKLGLLFSRYEAPDNTLVALGEEESWLLKSTPARYAVLVPMAFGGMLLAWRRRRDADKSAKGVARTTLVLALIGYAASLLLFNLSARFRMPVVPLAMVFSGYLLASLPSLIKQRTGLWLLVLSMLVGLGAGLVSEGPLGPLDAAELASHKAVRYKNRGQVAAGRGDLDAARADLQRAIKVAGVTGRASPDLFVLGAGWDRAEAMALAARQENDAAGQLRGRAVVAIEQALRLNGSHGPAQRMAGLLLYDEGAHSDAVLSFEGALAVSPRDREARQYLTLSLLALDRHEEARDSALLLVDQAPGQDDGHGLLALALLGLDDRPAARQALEEYDRLASMRETAGLVRRLPELPELTVLRAEADTP